MRDYAVMSSVFYSVFTLDSAAADLYSADYIKLSLLAISCARQVKCHSYTFSTVMLLVGIRIDILPAKTPKPSVPKDFLRKNFG